MAVRSLGLALVGTLISSHLLAATITVTTNADDLTPNDGSVSLREAIVAINAGTNLGDPDIIAQNPGTFGMNDTINFGIPGSGIQTIAVGATGNGALPALTKPVTINGYSQPGASANTLVNGDNAVIQIQLDGANAGPNADGVLLGPTSTASTIAGLAINRFSLNGIELQSSGNIVSGNFIGVNAQGTVAESNQNDGVLIANSSNNTIGGSTPAARNVVSGNNIDGIHIVGNIASPATGNIVQGNFVGVNATGTGSVGLNPNIAGAAAGNFIFGVEISGGNGNLIGGNTAGARNVVGFNIDGVVIDDGGQNNLIQGNFVGVGSDGVTAGGNARHGISLYSSDNLPPPFGPGQANEPGVSGNLIGLNPNSGFSGLGNLIASNGSAGVAVFGNPVANNATPAQNSGNSILGNSISGNGRSSPSTLIGIDLTNGFAFPQDDGFTANDSKGHGAANNPNNFQNFPLLTTATPGASNIVIVGDLTQAGSPATSFRIEFFSSSPDSLGGAAEGQTFLGSTNVTTNGSGVASFSATLAVTVPAADFITATATNTTADPSSLAGSANLFNTSEFSLGIHPAGGGGGPPPSSGTAIPALGASGLTLLVLLLMASGLWWRRDRRRLGEPRKPG